MFFCVFLQQNLKCLTHLDLFSNDVCYLDEYRSKLFKMLPTLKFLDDADQGKFYSSIKLREEKPSTVKI